MIGTGTGTGTGETIATEGRERRRRGGAVPLIVETGVVGVGVVERHPGTTTTEEGTMEVGIGEVARGTMTEIGTVHATTRCAMGGGITAPHG